MILNKQWKEVTMTTGEFIIKANEIIAIVNGMNYDDGAKLLLYVLSKLITNGCEEQDYLEVADDAMALLYSLMLAETKKGGNE